MPSQKTKIGPWPGGLNQRDQPRLIEDNELAAILNFDVTNEGTLRPRRPCRISTDVGTGVKYLMGSVLHSDGATYALISIDNAGTSSFRSSSNSQTWATAFTGTRAGTYGAVVQYNNFYWVVPKTSSSTGFRAPSITGAQETQTQMPWGDDAFILKDRLFIVRRAENRIYFSRPTLTDANVSSGTQVVFTQPDGGFFDVNPGDGQKINKVVIVGNQLTIFKRDATYIFQFSDNPLLDGSLRQVSYEQGAHDAIVYNNEVYTVNSRSVFKFLNGYFIDVGSKLDLYSDSNMDTFFDPGTRLSVVNKTLILGRTYNTKRMQFAWYAMNLDTGAWSEYFYPGTVGPSTSAIPVRSSSGSWNVYGDGTTGRLCAIPMGQTDEQLDTDSTGTLFPGYEWVTKDMTMGDTEEWKRLHAWAIECDAQNLPAGMNIFPYPQVIVNGSPNLYVGESTLDLVNTVSTRFRRVQMKYNAFKFGSTAVTVPVGTSASLTNIIPVFYSITAWLANRTKVVT